MLLIVLSLCGFAGALATRLLDPLITSIAADFHTTVAYVALLSSAFALPFGLSQPFLGPLGDSFGKAVVIKIAASILGVCLIASALAPDLTVLFLSRIIGGVAAGGIMPVCMALIGDSFPLAVRQVAMSRYIGATSPLTMLLSRHTRGLAYSSGCAFAGARAGQARKRVLRSALAATSLMLTVATVEGVAQERTKIARVGYLAQAPAASFAPRVDALRAGLLDLGYIEGSNLILGGNLDPLCVQRTIGKFWRCFGQPSALAECRKINSRRRIPSRRAVSGTKLHRNILVAIRNRSGVPVIEFGWAGVDGAASALALRFRDLFVSPAD